MVKEAANPGQNPSDIDGSLPSNTRLYYRDINPIPLIESHEQEQVLGRRIRTAQSAYSVLAQNPSLNGLSTVVENASNSAMISLAPRSKVTYKKLEGLNNEALSQLVLDGLHAYHELVVRNLRLVPLIVNRGYFVQIIIFGEEDLIQIGNLGLLKAAAMYDPERKGGKKAKDRTIVFSTFAGRCVKSAINNSLRTRNYSTPTGADGKKIVFVSTDEVFSYDQNGNGNGHKLGIESEQSAEDLERVELREESARTRRLVWTALNLLPDASMRDLIIRRFGLAGGQEEVSLEEIGRENNVTREAIRLRERKALLALADILQKIGYDRNGHSTTRSYSHSRTTNRRLGIALV